MLEKLWNFLFDLATSIGIKIIFALIMLFVGLKLAKWVLKFLRKSKLFERMESSLANFLCNILKVALYSIIFISVAIYIGVPATSFMAILTSAGVAIGLALQGSLANFAGGIMIIAFRPFKIGDFIEGSGYSGTVEDISIFYTKIVTADNKSVMLPNGGLSNAAIVNYSAKDLRRVDVPLSVSYDTDIDKMEKVMNDLFLNLDSKISGLKSNIKLLGLESYDDSSMSFRVCVDTVPMENYRIGRELRKAIKLELDKNKIEIPFPQVVVHNGKRI